MTADLTFTSDPLEVRITHYVKHTFQYNDWVISDKYIPHEGHPCMCKYSIIVTKTDISDDEMLYKYRAEGQDVVNLITSLIPLCNLPSLNSPKYQDFDNNRFLIDYKIPPQGWKTNYIKLNEKFEAVKNPELNLDDGIDLTSTSSFRIEYAMKAKDAPYSSFKDYSEIININLCL